jgi:stringent starvation protein B
MTGNPFSQAVIDAVMSHMNRDHAADSLLIVRSLGGEPSAIAAEMSGMDGDAIEFLATVDGRRRTVRVPWSEHLTERARVRGEVTRMYHDACVAVGVEPRVTGEH